MRYTYSKTIDKIKTFPNTATYFFANVKYQLNQENGNNKNAKKEYRYK